MNMITELKSKASSKKWNTLYIDRLKITSVQTQSDIVVGTRIKKSAKDFLDSEYGLLEKKSKNESRMPYYPMPNAGSYTDKPEAWNWISSLFSIYTRTKRSSSTKISWFNGEWNNHVKYRMRYLGYLRDDKKNIRYWTQGFKLLKNPAFQKMAYNKVNSDWYKKSSTKRVEKELKDLSTLVSELSYKIDFKRVYIPKGEDNYRPLGVPARPWRAYLNMLNTLIVWYDINNTDSQHAYSPGRGTYTVWKEIFKKIHLEENIYEFDLSKFFDKVDLNYNKKVLDKMGIPQNVQDFLQKLNQSIVKLTDEDLLDETINRNVIFNSDNTLNPNLPNALKNQLKKTDPEEAKKSTIIQNLLKSGYSLYKNIGVPQGAATSCSLSILNLKEMFNSLKGLVMYADDGLVFPENSNQEPNLNNLEAGIYQNQSKSGWVKKDSKWIKALKFCGLVYIPANIMYKGKEIRDYPRIMACTRNGSSLEFTEKEQFLCYLNEIYARDLASYKKMQVLKEYELGEITIGEWIEKSYENFLKLTIDERIGQLFTSKLGPMIMASLYNNSWQLSEPSDRRLSFTKGSWVSQGFANYLYNLFPWEAATYLNQKKESLEIELENLASRVNSFKKMKLNIQLYKQDIKSCETLVKQLERITKGLDFMLEEVCKVLTEEEKKLRVQAFDSLFKFRNDSDKEVIKITDHITKTKFLEYRKKWKDLLKEFFQLDISNVSAYATHDMLMGLDTKKKIKYCKVLKQISMNPEVAKELFNQSKSSKQRKALRKRRKENNQEWQS